MGKDMRLWDSARYFFPHFFYFLVTYLHFLAFLALPRVTLGISPHPFAFLHFSPSVPAPNFLLIDKRMEFLIFVIICIMFNVSIRSRFRK